MKWNPFKAPDRSEEILNVLDRAAEIFSFPAFDNGYVYLAIPRLSLFRSPAEGRLKDWAVVIETFGYSPREYDPGLAVQTFASTLHMRDSRDKYRREGAYENYLKQNPNNEYRAFGSVNFEGAYDPEAPEHISDEAEFVMVRGEAVRIPNPVELAAVGIELANPPRVRVFEMCRYLAETRPNLVLATAEEQRVSILPEMNKILELDEWRHPDTIGGELPSHTESFRQLAEVLITGDVSLYRPTEKANSHWSNWPLGGSL